MDRGGTLAKSPACRPDVPRMRTRHPSDDDWLHGNGETCFTPIKGSRAFFAYRKRKPGRVGAQSRPSGQYDSAAV